MPDGRQDILSTATSDLPAADPVPTGRHDFNTSSPFTDYDSFLHFFAENKTNLREQMRVIKKHAHEIINIEDAHLLSEYYRTTAITLKEMVDVIGPESSDEAIEGIDYPVRSKGRESKNDDIIVKPKLFAPKNDIKEDAPFEFMRFRSIPVLTETYCQLFNNHLDGMVNGGYLRREDLPVWRYFFGLSSSVDDEKLLKSKLLFLGNVKVLKFWIQGLYGVMYFSMPDPRCLPKGYYIMPAVIVALDGAGVRRKLVDGKPTTRDKYPTIVANTVRLTDRDLQVRSFTTTQPPSLDDATKIIQLLQPLGCKRKD